MDVLGPKLKDDDGPIRKAQLGEWPHMCSLLQEFELLEGVKTEWLFHSGASLIAPNVVLTSAHFL